MNPLSLYIHIPFCKQKCNYCDFASYAGKENLIEEYINTVINEIKHLRPTALSTVYIGGGTPSLIAPKYYEKIFKLLSIAPGAELSLEANPGTINQSYLKELKNIGVNRLSLGAQSFNDKHLEILGRIHNAKDIFKSFDDAQAAGFENINLDLIFALPNQTHNDWKEDLKQALSLKPQHLSIYNLQVEEGTKFYNIGDKLPRPTEDEEVAMFEYAIDTLKTAGFHHYEISNFAQPGFECKHNVVYWENGNYLGVGASASSHINGNRFDNPKTIEEYIKLTQLQNKVDLLGHKNQPDQKETIFMGLRLLDGLSKEKFKGYEKEVKELIDDGLLEQKDKIKLTHRGLLLANEVFKLFI
ncbi:MAG: radical SAM family heme chaperone HemW [Candidatus Margulisbacteria bacterium]|nr:radical SAM family heme chaperone HemW [Candidatus Margulisiibacteriota bacterium]MBU1021444.1 radical SAM family heme chaperone HemW [Candidatus Margulisiibacteriota bacterium]MBU1728365.1 radical SAM family heme chaperone HemW [Candidatus Margulisiibacteriota bacterium]MBU1955892.1 radical SAM family heme chaperone HemW [Candidatus Margulisiibacteriota bacterium]